MPQQLSVVQGAPATTRASSASAATSWPAARALFSCCSAVAAASGMAARRCSARSSSGREHVRRRRQPRRQLGRPLRRPGPVSAVCAKVVRVAWPPVRVGSLSPPGRAVRTPGVLAQRGASRSIVPVTGSPQPLGVSCARPVTRPVQVPAARLGTGDLLLPPMLGAPTRVLWRLDGPPVRALTAGARTVVLGLHELVSVAARPGLEDVVELAERFVHAVAGVMLAQRDHAAVAPRGHDAGAAAVRVGPDRSGAGGAVGPGGDGLGQARPRYLTGRRSRAADAYFPGARVPHAFLDTDAACILSP